jgi:hypothetical protein
MRNQRSLASKLLACASVGVVTCALVTPMSANATIHEIVAAFCSGGGVGVISADGHLEAPGVSDPTRSNFARPVIATRSTIVLSVDPLIIVTSDSKAAKYPPGTIVVDLDTFTFLLASLSDSAATHCRNFASLP